MGNLVFIENNRVLTDSLMVAESFNKTHDNVLRDIRNQLVKLYEVAEEDWALLNFEECEYNNDSAKGINKNRKYTKFLLTEDAFTLVTMSYTTVEAMKFKVTYIKAFREMEAKLKNQIQIPQTFVEALRLAADLAEENEKLKPKALYFDALVERNLLTNFRDTAKELKVQEKQFISWLLDNKFIYRDQKNKLRPYAEHTPNLFEIKEHQKGNWTGVQTLITPKGRETFRLLLKQKVKA